MSLIYVLIILAVVGVILWAINTQLPAPAWIKTVINVVACLFILLWLLQVFGLGSGDLPKIR